MRRALVEDPEPGGGPLAGVRVLAAETMQALPYASLLLAHLGADVVKVEPPGRGDSARGSLPTVVDRDGRRVGATYVRNNLGKRSVAIDLGTGPGRDLFRRLARRFDVVAENLGPGTMRRFGLAYEDLSADDARLVYLSVSGFGARPGERSPYRDRPAFAPVVEAMAGLYELDRAPDEPPRTAPLGALGDNAGALFGVVGLLAALYERERTGRGQHVDVSMLDATMGMAEFVLPMHALGEPQVAGRRKPLILDGFRAADGWFVVAVIRERHWQRFAKAIGRAEWLTDERFATRDGWRQHLEDVIRPAVEGWAADKTKHEAAAELERHGVSAGASNRAEDLLADEHVRLHDMALAVERPDGGDPVWVVGNPVKLDRPGRLDPLRWPTLGEHTDAVLGEELDLDGEALVRLRDDGIIA